MPQYQVLRPFSHKGQVQKKGDSLEMTEREARYLVMGSDPWVALAKETAEKEAPAPKAPKGKKPEEPALEGGEVNA